MSSVAAWTAEQVSTGAGGSWSDEPAVSTLAVTSGVNFETPTLSEQRAHGRKRRGLASDVRSGARGVR